MAPIDDAADRLGLDLSAGERADYRKLVEGMSEALTAVERAPAPRFETLHGSPDRYDDRAVAWRADPDREVASRTPSDREGRDPYNAWLCRAEVDGAPAGPLADWTVGVKDNVAVAGLPCTQGSRALADFVPAVDATVVGRLLDAGATLAGKQNMDAFAIGDAGELGDFGPTLNPRDETRLAGGSSSGSAAAVAAGTCDAAVGTDQAGSVRNPAAWCGVVGVKPTYGLVPYTGVFGMDFGFDHVGVLAGTAADAARVLGVLAGEDRQRAVGFVDPDGTGSDGPDAVDATVGDRSSSADETPPNGQRARDAADAPGADASSVRMDPRQPRGVTADDYAGAVGRDPDGLTVGVLAEGFGWDHADPAVEATVRAAIESLGDRGVEVVEVSVPTHRETPALVGVTAGLGAASTARQGGVGTTTPGWHWPAGRAAVAAAFGDPPATLSPAVVATLLFAGETDAAEGWRAYARAKNRVLALGRAYDERLSRCDALALPTSPVTAAEHDPDAGRVERVRRLSTLPVNTGAFNQTGQPAVSVPCGTVDGLPVGLQLVGRRFAEPTLFRLAAAVTDAGPTVGPD